MNEQEINAALLAELSSMPRNQLIALQKELGVTADGKVRAGGETMNAYRRRWEERQAQAAQARAAEIEADADRSNARAAEAKANADRINAEAAKKKADADAAAREDERSPWRQGVQSAAPLLGAVTGGVGGHFYADAVGRKHIAGQIQRNNAVSVLGDDIDRELRRSTPDVHRLRGLQKAARDLDLKRSKGPMAYPALAALLIEAGAAGYRGHSLEPGTEKDVFYGLSTAGMGGAGTLAAERLIRRGNEAPLPDSRKLAFIHQLDQHLDGPPLPPQPPAGPPTPRRPTKANVAEARAAGVLAPGWHRTQDSLRNAIRAKGGTPTFSVPITMAIAGLAGLAGARDARAEGRNPMAGAAYDASDALFFGMPSAYNEARGAGYSVPGSLGAGVLAGADSFATGGAMRTIMDPRVDPQVKRQGVSALSLPPGSSGNVFAGTGGPGLHGTQQAFAKLLSELERMLPVRKSPSKKAKNGFDPIEAAIAAALANAESTRR